MTADAPDLIGGGATGQRSTPPHSWVEPHPHGCEMFIPLDPARRGRSQAILQEVRDRLDRNEV